MAASHPRPLGVPRSELPRLCPARLPRYPLQTILRWVLSNWIASGPSTPASPAPMDYAIRKSMKSACCLFAASIGLPRSVNRDRSNRVLHKLRVALTVAIGDAQPAASTAVLATPVKTEDGIMASATEIALLAALASVGFGSHAYPRADFPELDSSPAATTALSTKCSLGRNL